jgi:type I restriction enzyme S subunit
VKYWDESVHSLLRPLKHCCHVNPAVLRETTDPDWEFDYIDIGSVSLSEGVTHKERMRFAASPSRARKPVREGDILVSTVRTYLQAIAAIEQAETPQVASTGFAVLRANKGTDARFLYRVVQSNPFVERVVSQSTGVSYPAINPSTLSNIEVPLPDLATQRQIADFLDRETARIDLLIEKKQQLVKLLGEKVRSDIQDLFQTLDAETWRIRHLGKVKNGAGFPVELQGNATNEIPFFKVKHLAVNGLDQRITDSEDTITKETSTLLRATVFPAGTIVFAKIGAALLLGRFSMLGTEGCVDNNVAAFVVNKRLADPDYLLLCFERFEMQLMVQPGTVPSLSTEKFINQSVPLPSLDEQIKLVSEVRRAVHRNERIVQRTRESIDRLKEYRSTLITAAVTGQIDVKIYAKSGATDRKLDAIEEVCE